MTGGRAAAGRARGGRRDQAEGLAETRRTLPYRFKVKGRIGLHAAVAADAGCTGKVKIRVKRGRRTVKKTAATVRDTCRFSRTVKFKSRKGLGRRGKLKFVVRFRGNERLLPRKAKRAVARYGRR